MRSFWVFAVCALVGAGCRCQQPLSDLAPHLVIVQPPGPDGGAGPWVLDFGNVAAPSTHTGSIVFQNQGLHQGSVLTATLRAGSDPTFSLTSPTMPAVIQPGSEATFTVTYSPKGAGNAVGWVDFTTDDTKLPSPSVQLVATSGAGQAIVCVEQVDGGFQCSDPETGTLSIDFGTLLVGSTASRLVRVHNGGSSTLDYFGTTLTPTTSPELTLSPPQSPGPDGGTPIAGGALVQFSADFTPTMAGTASGTAIVSTSDPSMPQVSIQMTGVGVLSLSCQIQVTPSPLDFGSVPNTGPVDQTLVVVDVGAQPCTITGLPLSGSTAFALPTPPTLPDTLQSNGVLTLDVRYTPSGTNVDMGTLTVDSNDPVNPMLPVTLEATSINPPPCVLSAQPPNVDFGGLAVGGREVKTVTLTATGTDVCTIVSTKLQRADTAYSVSSSAAFIAPPDAGLPFGTSGTLTVTYAPTAPGNDNDTLNVVYLDGAGLMTLTLPIPLEAAAGAPQLCVTPTQLHYGSVPVGQSLDLSFRMTACGNSTVHVSSITVEPTGTPFALAAPMQTLPLTIPVATSDSQGVSFTPTMTGQASAKVHVVSDDPIYPDQYVTLDTAPVTDCVLQVSPPSVNFGVLPANQASSKQVTLTNMGSGTCSLTGIALGAGSAAAGFSIPGVPNTLTIGSGSSAPAWTVTANLPPGAPSQRQGKITFMSNDATQPTVTIPLTAFLQGSGPYAQGWPKLYFDNGNTSHTVSDTSSVTGRLLWTFQMPALPTNSLNPCPTFDVSPVVAADGTVYQVDLAGTVHAIDPSGNQLWQTTGLAQASVDPFGATPFLPPDGGLYTTGGSDGAGNAAMYRLSSTGTIVAQAPPGLVTDGGDGFDVAPLLGADGYLYAFDDFPGVLIYGESPLNFVEGVNPAGAGGERNALALGSDNTSYWNFGSGGPPNASSAALTPAMPPSGGLAQLWSFTQAFSGVAIGATISIDPVTGYVLTAAGYYDIATASEGVAALNPTTGAEVWKRLLPAGPSTANEADTICQLFTTDVGNSGPSVGADGTVYIGNVDGMYALDGMTGAIKTGWPYATAAVTDTASIGGDGAIFFGTIDGTFYGLNSDGSLRFKMTAGGRVSSSPAIGPDGTVFFVADDAILYAVH